MHGVNLDSYAVDLGALRDDLGDDDEIVRDLCRMFGNDTPQLMTEIGQALETGDLKTVTAKRASSQGIDRGVHAPGVYAVAQQMETAGEQADAARAREVLVELQAAVSAMLLHLSAAAEAPARREPLRHGTRAK
jgi:HPt (histidine-containing phosphotransfer) domain-containing protein